MKNQLTKKNIPFPTREREMFCAILFDILLNFYLKKTHTKLLYNFLCNAASFFIEQTCEQWNKKY